MLLPQIASYIMGSHGFSWVLIGSFVVTRLLSGRGSMTCFCWYFLVKHGGSSGTFGGSEEGFGGSEEGFGCCLVGVSVGFSASWRLGNVAISTF